MCHFVEGVAVAGWWTTVPLIAGAAEQYNGGKVDKDKPYKGHLGDTHMVEVWYATT